MPSGSTQLGTLTTTAAGAAATSGAVLVVPLGATEQHGAHLPLATDTIVAVRLCELLASARQNVVVAPPIPYGASGEHAGFAGTISIGQDAVELIIVELTRSATGTFDRVLFVSGHGGNVEPVTRAVQKLQSEGRDVRAYFPRLTGDAHAGHTETSLMLALDESRVLMADAQRGDVRSLRETMPQLQHGGIRAVTDTGVLGDPTTATAVDGRQLWTVLEHQLLAHFDAWPAREVGSPIESNLVVR